MIVSSFHSFVTKPAEFFWNNRGWRWHSDSRQRSMDAGDVQDSAGVQLMEFGSEAFTYWCVLRREWMGCVGVAGMMKLLGMK